MKKYVNVMETIVEEALDSMSDILDCCLCEQCRNDIAAYTLNHLPTRYVVTRSGEIISKAENMRSQHFADVRTNIIRAAQIISKHPRH